MLVCVFQNHARIQSTSVENNCCSLFIKRGLKLLNGYQFLPIAGRHKFENQDKPTIVDLIVQFMFVQIKSVQCCYLKVTKVDNQK